jgi:transaldolase
MYKEGGSHVEVLAASVRSLDHLLASILVGADIVTAPFAVLADWARAKLPVPEAGFSYAPSGLAPVPYEGLDLGAPVDSFDVAHPLTEKGIEKFAADWNALITR